MNPGRFPPQTTRPTGPGRYYAQCISSYSSKKQSPRKVTQQPGTKIAIIYDRGIDLVQLRVRTAVLQTQLYPYMFLHVRSFSSVEIISSEQYLVEFNRVIEFLNIKFMTDLSIRDLSIIGPQHPPHITPKPISCCCEVFTVSLKQLDRIIMRIIHSTKNH